MIRRTDRQPARQMLLAATILAASVPITALSAPSERGLERRHATAGGCTVMQDNGRSFTDLSVGRCQDYYSKLHPCAGDVRPGVCKNLDMFMAVNWGKMDMIINTHRGVWGLELSKNASIAPKFSVSVGGAPENSLAGVAGASFAGFRSVEYDIFLMRNDVEPNSSKTPVINHFTDLRGFTNYMGAEIIPAEGRGGSGFLMSNAWGSWGTPELLTLRDRDGNVSTMTDSNFTKVETFLAKVKAGYPDMVVVFDPKYARPLTLVEPKEGGGLKNNCIGFCGDNGYPSDGRTEEVLGLISAIVGDAINSKMLDNICIKMPQMEGLDGASVEARIDKDHGAGTFQKLLWAPQPDVGGRMEQKVVLDYIESWLSGNRAKAVMFWDTAITSRSNWMGAPFTIGLNTYFDLMDYLKQVSGRRSAFWTPDPAGPGGRHGNFSGSWFQAGNDEQDMRGDVLYNLGYSYATNAVVSSDRPDQVLQVRVTIGAGPAGERAVQ